MLNQLDSENADLNISSQITVLTHTPDVSNAMKCVAGVMLGDGSKNLDGAGGDFEFTITVGGNTLQPDPYTIEFSSAVQSYCPSNDFLVPANKEVIIKVKSPNGADIDVGIIAYLADATSGDVIAISQDKVAADNMESQFDTTGLSGDTFPANQGQINNISTGSAAVNIVASGVVVTTGSETLTYAVTDELNGVVHEIAPDGGNTEFYYEFNIGSNSQPSAFLWWGYAQSQGDSYTAKYYDWVAAGWKQTDIIVGKNGTTVIPLDFEAIANAVGTSANAGKVRLQFTSADGTNFATDRIFCSKTAVAVSAGYQDGRIWVNTNASNTNTTDYIDGVADNAVSTWAAALTLSASLGIKLFHIIGGSTIQLSANSDAYDLTGMSWTLQLNNQSIAAAVITGGMVTGIGTGAMPHFHNCQMGAVTLGPSHFEECGIGKDDGLFTGGAAGQYTFYSCYSLVPGSGTPDFKFDGLASATGINVHGLLGGSSWTLDSDCTVSVEVLAGGGQTFVTGGANVELRGIFRDTTFVLSGAGTVQIVGVMGDVTLSGAASTTVNIYGTASSVEDTSTGTNVNNKTSIEVYDPPTHTEMTDEHTALESYIDDIATDVLAVKGAVAGKCWTNAAGTQVKLYDFDDALLVTLDRTGADPGPYTWTPTWA